MSPKITHMTEEHPNNGRANNTRSHQGEKGGRREERKKLQSSNKGIKGSKDERKKEREWDYQLTSLASFNSFLGLLDVQMFIGGTETHPLWCDGRTDARVKMLYLEMTMSPTAPVAMNPS